MERRKITFNVELDGLVYECNAVSKTEGAVTSYVLDIEAMDQIYRVDMELDGLSKNFMIKNHVYPVAPEIMELEFKISDVLSHSFIQ